MTSFLKIGFPGLVILLSCLFPVDSLSGTEITTFQAKVYIHRDSGWTGKFNKSDIFFDNRLIFELPQKTTVIFSCAPGKHTIRSENKKKVLTFETLEKTEYHILIKSKISGFHPVMLKNSEIISQFDSFNKEQLNLQEILTMPAPVWWKKYLSSALELFGVIFLMVLGYVILPWAWTVCKHFFGEGSGIILFLYILLGIGVICFIGFIPLAYVKDWIPKGLQLSHMAFVLISALLFSGLVIKFDRFEPLQTMVIAPAISALVIFYLSLTFIAGLNYLYPETFNSLIIMNIWEKIGFTASIALVLILNIVLFVKLDESRDLSGAYETATRGYWATQDGKHYMNALKSETGEWTPPTSAFLRYLIFNLIVLGIILALFFKAGLNPLILYFLYMGLLVLSCVLVTLLAEKVQQ
ncbi:MAG: hypothetical protein GY699_06325 [Desulfobacteraceae bacterium]|nr:hypothetical protein [Desulfobacteraceae bacterium]